MPKMPRKCGFLLEPALVVECTSSTGSLPPTSPINTTLQAVAKKHLKINSRDKYLRFFFSLFSEKIFVIFWGLVQ